MWRIDLGRLTWKCYTKKGSIEIYNRVVDTIPTNGEHGYCAETVSNTVDENLIDIIEELYYLVALENIDSVENILDKDILLLNLEEREKKYNVLLCLKKLYYSELCESINRINDYCKCEDLELHEEIQKARECGRILDCARHERCSHIYMMNLFRLFECPSMDLKVLKKLFNAIIDICIHNENHNLEKYNKQNIKEWFKLFLVLRDESFGITGEIIWLAFFLNVFRQMCSTSECLIWHKLELDEQWKEQLVHDIEQTNRLVEAVIGEKIFDIQKDMMMCYLNRPMSSDSFDAKIEDFVKAIQQLSKVKEYNDLNRYLDKKEEGCIAIMHSNSKRYAALSGGEYFNRYSRDLSQILGTGYKVVDLNPDVRYYHTKQAYITYGQYDNWKNTVSFDEKRVSNIRRMFSCCERKLLTELYGKSNINYTIYVKKKVCSMCEKAIKDFEEVDNSRGLIKYPKKINVCKPCIPRKDKYSNLNEIAKGVRDGVLPDMWIYS